MECRHWSMSVIFKLNTCNTKSHQNMYKSQEVKNPLHEFQLICYFKCVQLFVKLLKSHKQKNEAGNSNKFD